MNHLENVGKLIANASYFYYNLRYLVLETNGKERKIFNGYPVLKKIRLTLWSLIVLDLHKLLSKSSNDKFRISKLVNCLIELHKKIKWENEIDIKVLCKIKDNISLAQPKIEKIKEIRDTQIAHFDDINLNYRFKLQELDELIILCQDTYDTINYALNKSNTLWEYSDAENFKPVVKNLNKYSKLRNLYYRNLTAMNENIDINEIGKIIKASN